MKEVEKINYAETDDFVKDVLKDLTGGAKDNMNNYRKTRNQLEQYLFNVFDGEIGIDSKTKKTKLIKGHQCYTETQIFSRRTNLPVIDIEPINRSKTALKEKTRASMVKALDEWFVRVAGVESVFEEGKLWLFGFGDFNIRPFLTKTGKENVFFPAVEDIKSENLLIDPNATYIFSESKSKQAQFYGYTQQYPKANLVDRFGEWILDYVTAGATVDDSDVKHRKSGTDENDYYEVVEAQNKSGGMEAIIIGGTGFPVLKRGKGAGTVPKDLEGKVTWSEDYIYQNGFKQNRLMLSNLYCFYNPRDSYNLGLVQQIFPEQVLSELSENLQMDNLIKRMDSIAYVIGANDRTDQAMWEYRKEQETNRYAYWKIPASLNQANKPEVGVLKFDGLPAQEGQVLTENTNNLIKNITGVDPRQQEVQKNTAVTQTQIVEEKSLEAVSAIMEKNVPNLIDMHKMFITFCVAHNGFGLDDVKLSFEKFFDEALDADGKEREFPDGIEGTASIPEIVKAIEGFEFDVIIDKSDLVKKSRVLEQEQIIKAMGLIDPTTDPDGFITLKNRLFKSMGLPVKEVDPQQIAQSTAQGGNSQFQAKGAAPAGLAELPVQPPV